MELNMEIIWLKMEIVWLEMEIKLEILFDFSSSNFKVATKFLPRPLRTEHTIA